MIDFVWEGDTIFLTLTGAGTQIHFNKYMSVVKGNSKNVSKPKDDKPASGTDIKVKHEGGTGEVIKNKKRKREETDVDGDGGTNEGKEKKVKRNRRPKKKSGSKDPRASAELTLFAGQIPFDTPSSEIKSLFESKEGISEVTVRMLTDKKSGAFKGLAFIEFKSIKEATLGLSLHHSTVRGRRINVERTLKGSSSSSTRKEQLLNLNSNSLKLSEKKVKIIYIYIQY